MWVCYYCGVFTATADSGGGEGMSEGRRVDDDDDGNDDDGLIAQWPSQQQWQWQQTVSAEFTRE